MPEFAPVTSAGWPARSGYAWPRGKRDVSSAAGPAGFWGWDVMETLLMSAPSSGAKIGPRGSPEWAAGLAPAACPRLHRQRITLREPALVPIRISGRHRARRIELRDLLGRQVPADRAEILAQLLFIARADQHRRDRGPLQQPVERDLRHRLAGLLRHFFDRIENAEQVVVRHRRPHVGGLGLADRRGQRRSALELAREAPPAERTPHDGAQALIEPERHQLPLVVAADQRVVGLVRDIARIAVAVRDTERLHQMPAGKIRHARVADLAGAHESVDSTSVTGVFASKPCS